MPMSSCVTLLLILSALLSALTGAGERARAPQAAVAVARAVEGQAVQAVIASAATTRPVAVPIAPTTIDGRPLRLALATGKSFGEQRRE